MGKQYNKTEKKRRRLDYKNRKKEAIKAARAVKPKKKAPAKKKEVVAEAAPVAG